MIYNDMTELLRVSQPEAVAIEELFFGHNVTTGINVAQSRGVILLAVRQAGVPVFEYKPMQVKQAVVGYGNATKHQVQDMTKRLLDRAWHRAMATASAASSGFGTVPRPSSRFVMSCT